MKARCMEIILYMDDNDIVTEVPDRDRRWEIKEIKKDITFYKKAFSKIENKYNINGKPADEAANDIVETIIKKQLLIRI